MKKGPTGMEGRYMKAQRSKESKKLLRSVNFFNKGKHSFKG